MAASPLISAAELRDRIARREPALRVVDCRWVLGQPGAGRAAYDAGHLPGAVHLDIDTDLADPDGYGAPGRHPLPSPAAFAEVMRRIGLRDADLVVAYDDVGGWVAARLWWMLESLGHRRAAVLDGGIQAWRAAGGELTTDVPSFAETTDAELHLGTAWTGVIEREELRRRLGSVVLLDARAAARYRGELEPIDPVAGHIPTARSAPTDGNLVAPGGAFLPASDLEARFRALGADGSQGPVVTSCGSGVSALHHALALRAAGLPDPILYVGSYSDWSRSGESVATGSEPGDPPPARG
ncbi:MAG TPA: sulfurtransferase [Candidatus Limnocylindrales bacterium]|nr:sulfurtransferase [Candidatus Limnocylindrales bacterium]